MNDKKWELTLNLLTLVPALIRGIQPAVAAYHRGLEALKDGVTDEELAAASARLDAEIAQTHALLAELDAKAGE